MLTMDIIEKIGKQYSELSTKQKKIADYLVNSPDEACFLPMKELSHTVGTTEVTLINFCHKIGFDTFLDLKKALQDVVRTKLSPNDKMITAISKSKGEGHLAEIINLTIHGVYSAVENLKTDDLNKALKIIKNAGRIYLYGYGLSATVSDFLLYRLSLLGLDVVNLFGELRSISLNLARVSKKDIFIISTFPRYSQTAVSIARKMHAAKNKVIIFTDQPSSPIYPYGDVTFLCDSSSAVFYNSINSAMAILDILTSSLAFELKDKLVKNINEVSKIEKSFSKDILK